MACGCSGRTCSCALQGGSNVTVTGSGSSADPYIINSSQGATGALVVTTTIAGLNTLATAGSLVVGTKYVVTDWTASPNLAGPNILLVDALDTHTPSGAVQVRTPLGNAGPCDGEFLWNFSTLNLMTRLRDTLGNDVNTVGGSTIGQFPWANTSVLDNTVREGSFAGIPTGSWGFSNCQLDSVAVNFAGAVSASMTGAKIRSGSITVTAGGILAIGDASLDDVTLSCTGATANLTITDSALQSGAVSVTAGTGTINACTLSGATVNGSSAAAGAWTIANTTMKQGTVTISGGGAGATLLQGVDIVGQGGYALTINVGSAVTPSPQITNTNFIGRSAGSAGLTLQGSSTYTIDRTTIYGSSSVCVLDGTSGTVSFNNDQLFLSSATSRASGATGNFSISASTILGNASALTQPATAGSFSISDSVIRDSTITQGGSGSLTVQQSRVYDAATISTAAGSVRALTVQNSQLSAGAAITYTRTAPATAGAADTINAAQLSNSTVSWTGATDPATSQTVTNVRLDTTSFLTVTNPAGATPVSNVIVDTDSSLTVSAGGSVFDSRFSNNCAVTTGAFSHSQVIVEGPYTVTFTVAKTNFVINANLTPQDQLKWVTIPRYSPQATAATMVTQTMRVAFFTANASGTTTGVNFGVQTATSGGTPTLVQLGLFKVDATGAGTLIASTTNDTTLFNAVAVVSKAWTASTTITIGERYAIGLLVVQTAGTVGAVVNASASTIGSELLTVPFETANMAGQATMPSSFAVGALTSTGTKIYARAT